LTTISCGHKINYQKFDDYAKETARLFVHLYPWFYLPASVHKVLIHGGDIIRAALLPIGGKFENFTKNIIILKFKNLNML